MHQQKPADAFRLLTTDPPAVSERQAAALLRDHYGLEGNLKMQYSERDQNFFVRTNDGEEYILKIANSVEIPAITDLQIGALLHLENSHAGIHVPRVIRTTAGETCIRMLARDGRRHSARVLSWLPGTLQDFDDLGPETAAKMGTALASLGKALRNFAHPASDYPLLWDIKQAGKLRELLDTIDDTALREDLRQYLEEFVTDIEPRLPALRAQVIHNDLNPGNIIFDPNNGEVAGIIDFGDMIRSPLVADVAVASAYLCKTGNKPFQNVFDFVRAYHALRPLVAEEFELLPYLITIRTLTTVMISHWRASRYPDNRDATLGSETHALQMITTLGQYDPSAISLKLQDYCDQKT
jgi:Ser/Thr protein kinase RdoA (MazF antagonist)